MRQSIVAGSAVVLLGLATAAPATATPFFFSTGSPDGRMASATRPDSAGNFEIESADDFVLTNPTSLTSATFTGLIPDNSTVRDVVVEIYRVFPKDSNIARTSGKPTFSTPQVPTRVNSPSDIAFRVADSASGALNFTTNMLGSFTVANTVRPGGIHLNTGGNGSITGQEVEFGVSFTSPIGLPADHYFFVPQVELDNGDFLWLSAPKPIVAPDTPFPPGATDLQSWTRDADLDPDWMRIGTDIVGGVPAPTFNAAFSLAGDIPEPATMMVFGTGLLGLSLVRRRRA
jgi:PEP-CTERM motif